MQKRIEIARTFWIGINESQRNDLRSLTGLLQHGDLVKFAQNMNLEASALQSITDTVNELRELLKDEKV